MTARIQRRDQTIAQADTILAQMVRVVIAALDLNRERAFTSAELRTLLGDPPKWRWGQVVKELVDHGNVSKTGNSQGVRYQWRAAE